MPRAILLLVTDLQIGGTPIVVRELAIRLNAPPAVRVDVACLAGRGPVSGSIGNRRYSRVYPERTGRQRCFDLSRLGKLIADNRYDTVFSFLLHANAAAAAVAPFLRDVRNYFSPSKRPSRIPAGTGRCSPLCITPQSTLSSHPRRSASGKRLVAHSA